MAADQLRPTSVDPSLVTVLIAFGANLLIAVAKRPRRY